MSLVDIFIIAILFIYLCKGFKNGAIKELVSFAGGFLVLIIAYLLKNPLSVYLYEHLPFIKFGGILSGISVLNIIIYELIAFVIVASVLIIIYRILISVTNIIETILKFTVILGIPSKIIGAIIGLIEGIFVIFILLFISSHISGARTYLNESKYSDMILTKTPILSSAIGPIYNSAKEIYDIAENYKDNADRNIANLEALDILLKYKVLDVENANKLVESGKLNIQNIDSVLNKYQP